MVSNFLGRRYFSIGLAVCLFCSVPAAIWAHKLTVFAWVEGGDVIVEGKLPKGKRPQLGVLRVYDGEEKLLLEKPIQADGTARFPLKDWKTGLKVVIDIGEGHQSYWILTPFDIQAQQKESLHEAK